MQDLISNETALEYVSANVKDMLAVRALSQRELARRTGDHVMTLNNLVTQRHMPSGAVLARIAEALGVTIDDLFRAPKKK